MKIKMLTPICGHRHDAKGKVIGDFAHKDGAIVEWPDAEARRLIERGYAESVESPAQSQKR